MNIDVIVTAWNPFQAVFLYFDDKMSIEQSKDGQRGKYDVVRGEYNSRIETNYD